MKKTHGNWTTIEMPSGYLNDPDHDLKYIRKINNLPSIKSNIESHCTFPTSNLNIDHKGRIFLCACDGWLPYSVGSILDFNSIEQIYKSSIAQEIIQSVEKKEYKFCATNLCQIQKFPRILPKDVLEIGIGIDIGCNLACPSCRERIIFDESEHYINEKILWANQIIHLLKQVSDKQIHVLIGANGEPFVSKVYLHLLDQLKKIKNIEFSVKTNATRIIKEKKVLDSEFFHKIKTLSISIDAATQSTYEKVRHPGKWFNLIENLDYVRSLNLNVEANFVVQKENFKEIPKFIDFCYEYKMKPKFSLLADWGSFGNYHDHAVHVKESPFYTEYRSIIDTLPENLVKNII